MLYYIHGYGSSPNSAKGALFQKELKAQSIDYHQGRPENLKINECLQRIVEAIRSYNAPILIGSSLGGYLAARVALEEPVIKSIVLLNPAIIPRDTDVSMLKGMPHGILIEMADHQLLSKKIHGQTILLLGVRDEEIQLAWSLDFAMAQLSTVRFLQDDHGFTSNLTRLPGIITELLRLRE